jgi:methionine-rich copper-binding protein CopC
VRRLLLPLRSTVLVAALGAVLAAPTALTAAPAWAHTRLVSSTPSAGAPVEAPGEVALVFTDLVQPDLSALSVRDADGEEHVSGAPSPGGDGSSVSQALRSPLEPGTYRVAYRVLAADGHPVTGSFEITAVARASVTPPPAPSTTAPTALPTPEARTGGAMQPAAAESDDEDGLPVLPLVAGGLVAAGVAGLLARRLGGAPPEA